MGRWVIRAAFSILVGFLFFGLFEDILPLRLRKKLKVQEGVSYSTVGRATTRKNPATPQKEHEKNNGDIYRQSGKDSRKERNNLLHGYLLYQEQSSGHHRD